MHGNHQMTFGREEIFRFPSSKENSIYLYGPKVFSKISYENSGDAT